MNEYQVHHVIGNGCYFPQNETFAQFPFLLYQINMTLWHLDEEKEDIGM